MICLGGPYHGQQRELPPNVDRLEIALMESETNFQAFAHQVDVAQLYVPRIRKGYYRKTAVLIYMGDTP